VLCNPLIFYPFIQPLGRTLTGASNDPPVTLSFSPSSSSLDWVVSSLDQVGCNELSVLPPRQACCLFALSSLPAFLELPAFFLLWCFFHVKFSPTIFIPFGSLTTPFLSTRSFHQSVRAFLSFFREKCVTLSAPRDILVGE